PSPTQDFNLHQVGASVSSAPQASSGIVKKYGDVFHAPHGIDAFYDYEQALEYSKQVNKPVLLDFTGSSCVKCRKMEDSVWPDPQVLKRLKEHYILVSLYVDDRTDLAPEEHYISTFSGEKIRRVGQK